LPDARCRTLHYPKDPFLRPLLEFSFPIIFAVALAAIPRHRERG
jgi:hypothetical protein